MELVVITSINPPTEAVGLFSLTHKTIVIGDRKSPDEYSCSADYYSIPDQLKLGLKTAGLLPENNYSRKNIGYLLAINRGADVIIDIDDDNIPYFDYSFPDFDGEYNTVINKGYINTYQYFTDQYIWPRGLPLRFITKVNKIKTVKKINKIGVWQGLADGDPDVDAIYRLVINKPCIFDKKDPLVLDPMVICPYNSQNTATRKELFPLLYIPSYVSWRMTDMMRGVIAQPIMWEYGYRLGFCQANVFQDRNLHDYFDDFRSEVSVYLNIEDIFDIALGLADKNKSIAENMVTIYNELIYAGLVGNKEMKVLETFLHEAGY